MKEILIVSIGSFFGGGMRYWISKMVQSCTVIAFPVSYTHLTLPTNREV